MCSARAHGRGVRQQRMPWTASTVATRSNWISARAGYCVNLRERALYPMSSHLERRETAPSQATGKGRCVGSGIIAVRGCSLNRGLPRPLGSPGTSSWPGYPSLQAYCGKETVRPALLQRSGRFNIGGTIYTVYRLYPLNGQLLQNSEGESSLLFPPTWSWVETTFPIDVDDSVR